MPSYRVRRASAQSALTGQWDSLPWSASEPLEIAHFHPRSSEHRPRARARLLFDPDALHVLFRVEDRYVRAVSTRFQGPVWEDSCVELFLRPREGAGYFNFEMNCIGTLLLYYIEDPTRTPDGFAKYRPVEERHTRDLRVYHSLQGPIDPELPGPLEWVVQYRLPFALFTPYVGAPVQPAGQRWRANLFKCADGCSHPHWASWAPIGEELNFHQPERFGELRFDP